MKNTKSAISLINLIGIVIIIIVIGTLILVLGADSLDISGNRELKFKTMIESYESSLESYKAKLYVKDNGTFDELTLNANLDTLEYNGTVQNGNIYTIIPSLKGSKYRKKIKVVAGKLDVNSFTGKYLKWAKEKIGDLVHNPEEDKSNEEQVEKRLLGEGTSLTDKASNEKVPYVPDEFNYVDGTTVEGGYTIIDNNNNEYVWVPVKDMSPFEVESNTKLTANIVTDFSKIKDSISKYGGFYIGKYEASLVDGKVSSIKNSVPITNIKWGDSITQVGSGAYSYAKSVSLTNNYKKFKSTLLYDSMWTATLDFMGILNDKSGLEYGNYNGANFSIENKEAKGSKDGGESFDFLSSKATNERILLTTGATKRNCVKNIYDIAGNVSEWTISLLNNNDSTAIVRGGDYNDLSNLISAKYFLEKSTLEESSTIGFRVALYLE